MNREILFRGQLRRKGEKVRLDGTPVESKWVYGGICTGNGSHSIIYQTNPEFRKYPVYTDTIGQYTGLTDRNGVKIFEGDIVRAIRNGTEINTSYISFDGGVYCCILLSGHFIDCCENLYEQNLECGLEVIGNIYDGWII